MPTQKIWVDLKVPADPRRITQLLKDEGLTVEGITEVRGGIFNSVDVVSFVVEHADDALISVLAGVVVNWISGAKNSVAQRGVGFSIKERTSGDTVIIKVKGDGNYVQVHPRPKTSEEE